MTIEADDLTPCNVALVAMPVDLVRIVTIKHPTWRVTCRVEEEAKSGFT